MSPLDLIRSHDGSMSITKLAAATGYLLASVLFVRLQWSSPFNELLWVIYLGTVVTHAAFDKTAAMVKDFQERKLDTPKEAP